MNIFHRIHPAIIHALLEDIGNGDITTNAVVPASHVSKAVLIAKEDFVLAGLPFAKEVFRLIVSGAVFKAYKNDGDSVKNRTVVAEIRGNTRGLLLAERTALNFLQRLSGIATLTKKFIKCVKGFPVKITDTRKTTPGLRFFEKYAVKSGGGTNHRFGLYDGILIKDNHINTAGGIKKAVRLAEKSRLIRDSLKHKIEVEVKNIREVRSALSAGAGIIMLDNMSPEDMKRAVRIIREKAPYVIIEASGNIRIDNIRSVAETGVDLISVGALTHSATAVDISMKVVPLRRIH